ncbi:MAG: hypothetical protein H0T17_09180 [Propionibacteriales bacterium]|nr:hypothetical protein [Propionibacteriales bacterium]
MRQTIKPGTVKPGHKPAAVQPGTSWPGSPPDPGPRDELAERRAKKLHQEQKQKPRAAATPPRRPDRRQGRGARADETEPRWTGDDPDPAG